MGEGRAMVKVRVREKFGHCFTIAFDAMVHDAKIRIHKEMHDVFLLREHDDNSPPNETNPSQLHHTP
jgi:hypothetical protein